MDFLFERNIFFTENLCAPLDKKREIEYNMRVILNFRRQHGRIRNRAEKNAAGFFEKQL